MSASKLNAWLRLLRVSNYPTVVSNALTGVAAGAFTTTGRIDFPWTTAALAAVALLLLYAAGMALNDALDANVDKTERPDRPIPSGAIKRSHAFTLGALGILAALSIVALTGTTPLMFGIGLTVCIITYDAFHARHPSAVALMAACRALAILTAATMVAWPLNWSAAAPLAALAFAYTISISLLARREAGDRRRIRLVVLMICGFSLIDAAALCIMEQWTAAAIALGCFVLALTAQRRVIGS